MDTPTPPSLEGLLQTASFDPIAHPPLTLALILIGVLFGVINTLAGGGSVLSLPALIFLGLPPHAANATNRVVGITQTLSALASFWRGGAMRGERLWVWLALAPIGGVIGARASLWVTQQQMGVAIQISLCAIALFTLLAPRRLLDDPPPPPRGALARALFGALTVLYGGFLQAGIGLVSVYYLRFVCGYDLVRATALKVVIIAGLTLPSLLTFVYYGEVRWAVGLTLALGGAVGAQVGVRLSLSARGARVIRAALPVAALLMVAGLAWKAARGS